MSDPTTDDPYADGTVPGDADLPEEDAAEPLKDEMEELLPNGTKAEGGAPLP
jgi:hypothetical protein